MENGKTNASILKEIRKEEQELKDLLKSKVHLLEQLDEIEAKIYRIETNYLEETRNTGNIIKGFDHYLVDLEKSNNNPNHASQLLKRIKIPIDKQDRIFTLSAATDHEAIENKVLNNHITFKKKKENSPQVKIPKSIKEKKMEIPKIKIKLKDLKGSPQKKKATPTVEEEIDV